jgi:hypothetical protein
MIDDTSVRDPEQTALAACILAIGTPRFYRSLLRFTEIICGFEHLSVFSFSPTFEPRIEVLEGLEDPSITNLSARPYMGFGYHGSIPRRRESGSLAHRAMRPLFWPYGPATSRMLRTAATFTKGLDWMVVFR